MYLCYLRTSSQTESEAAAAEKHHCDGTKWSKQRLGPYRHGLFLRYAMSVFCQFSAPEVDWMRIACDIDVSFLAAAKGLPPRNARDPWEAWASSKVCDECFLSFLFT